MRFGQFWKKPTKFQKLLLTIQELADAQDNIIIENKELATMLMLSNEEAENLDQVREHRSLLNREVHIGATLQVDQRLK